MRLFKYPNRASIDLSSNGAATGEGAKGEGIASDIEIRISRTCGTTGLVGGRRGSFLLGCCCCCCGGGGGLGSGSSGGFSASKDKEMRERIKCMEQCRPLTTYLAEISRRRGLVEEGRLVDVPGLKLPGLPACNRARFMTGVYPIFAVYGSDRRDQGKLRHKMMDGINTLWWCSCASGSVQWCVYILSHVCTQTYYFLPFLCNDKPTNSSAPCMHEATPSPPPPLPIVRLLLISTSSSLYCTTHAYIHSISYSYSYTTTTPALATSVCTTPPSTHSIAV